MAAFAHGCANVAGLYPGTDGILTMQDAYCQGMDEQEQGLMTALSLFLFFVPPAPDEATVFPPLLLSLRSTSHQRSPI